MIQRSSQTDVRLGPDGALCAGQAPLGSPEAARTLQDTRMSPVETIDSSPGDESRGEGSNAGGVRRYRTGRPPAPRSDLLSRWDGLGDLLERVYHQLVQDGREQGVDVPLHDLDELKLRREWVVTTGGTRGVSQVGSQVGFLRTAIGSWLCSLRSEYHRSQRVLEEYLIAVHEMSHSVGNATFVPSVRNKTGWPILTRVGLLLNKIDSQGWLFFTLEEVHATLTEMRAAARLGLRHTSREDEVSISRSTKSISKAERLRLRTLLEEFGIGTRTDSGDLVVRCEVPVFQLPFGGSIDISGAYRALLGATQAIVHHVLQRETPRESLDAFSKLLSRAHAGDFSDHKMALSIIRDGVGSDGLRIFAVTRPAVDEGGFIFPILAEAVKLPQAQRETFVKKLLHLVTGELLLAESLQAGRAPTLQEVDQFLTRGGEVPETLHERFRVLTYRNEALPDRFARLAMGATIGALARGDRLTAYRICINTHQPRSALPPEVNDAFDSIPFVVRAGAQIRRAIGLVVLYLRRVPRE